MYPTDCYIATSPDKVEAVKYYVDLNKSFLKQAYEKDYQAFCDFIRGEGKEIFASIAEAKDDKELNALVAKIDLQLPYAKSLKGKTFEQKMQFIFREMATSKETTVNLNGKSGLKMQRALAGLYDEVVELCNKYRDAVNNRRYVRETIENPEALNRLYAGKGQDKETFVANLKKLAEETSMQTKQARKCAFVAITDYNVAEVAYRIAQEEAAATR